MAGLRSSHPAGVRLENISRSQPGMSCHGSLPSNRFEWGPNEKAHGRYLFHPSLFPFGRESFFFLFSPLGRWERAQALACRMALLRVARNVVTLNALIGSREAVAKPWEGTLRLLRGDVPWLRSVSAAAGCPFRLPFIKRPEKGSKQPTTRNASPHLSEVKHSAESA